MLVKSSLRTGLILGLVATLAACSSSRDANLSQSERLNEINPPDYERYDSGAVKPKDRSKLLDLLRPGDNPNTTIEVNKYIWQASLEVLDFLPVQSVDPFSGVITTGFGTPPGGGRAYRATIYVQDPALDARSLKVALNTSAGPASAETVRAVEDAILTRARQLRVRDSKL